MSADRHMRVDGVPSVDLCPQAVLGRCGAGEVHIDRPAQ